MFVLRLRELFAIEASDEQIITAWCDMFTPNPEVHALLPRLKDAHTRLVLGSNTNALHYAWLAGEFETVLANFDERVLSHVIGYRKPEPGFFEACMDAAGCEPAECVFVDDRAEFVDVAIGLGTKGIVYRPDGSFEGQLRGRT